jgi:phosphatidate cytidylyltransferase
MENHLKSEIYNLKWNDGMAGLARKKIWTAVLAVPPLVALIAAGPAFVLFLMVLLATFLGLREFYNLSLPRSGALIHASGIAMGLFLSVAILYGGVRVGYPVFVFLLFLLFLLFMGTSQDLLLSTAGIGTTLLGIFYIGFLLSHVSLIRQLENGGPWVLFLIATVWAGDICAFLFGSLFGKHKLYPKISPKKTYEGLGGAVLGSSLTAFLFALLFLPRLGKGLAILLGISIALLGQFGDFTESMLKRGAQVKDSGSFIPGHGGMLDRLDSFFFSAPFLYYVLLYLIKEGQ